MKIYLAGPDVFLPDAMEIGRRKAAICARHGLTGLYPLDNAIDLTAVDASLAIFTNTGDMSTPTSRVGRTCCMMSRVAAPFPQPTSSTSACGAVSRPR